MAEIMDKLTLHRVANGWVILPGSTPISDFTHIAATSEALAKHVQAWAQAQVASPLRSS